MGSREARAIAILEGAGFKIQNSKPDDRARRYWAGGVSGPGVMRGRRELELVAAYVGELVGDRARLYAAIVELDRRRAMIDRLAADHEAAVEQRELDRWEQKLEGGEL